MKITFVSGKKVGVIGMARSGIAAANLARSLGARVLISEMRTKAQCRAAAKLLCRGILTEFGGHTPLLLESDLIIKSPGVPPGVPVLKNIQRKKIPLWSEIEFALHSVSPRLLAAITGTNGKTTTTALVGELFRQSGRNTVVGGNIGTPLATLAERIDARTTVVLEMSSYQLEDSPRFHPQITAVLNITPDHMDHHGTMRWYTDAKAGIFRNQTAADFCILNYDDPRTRRMASRCPAQVVFFSRKKTLARGVYYRGGRIVVALGSMKFTLDARLKIPGLHNVENALAAVAMAVAGGVKPVVIERVIGSFPGVEHRIEFVAGINGVKYYNDSKGTNVDSTRVALESFVQPIWLILGGRDKGSSYEPLRKLIEDKVCGVLLIGEAADNIRRGLSGSAAFYDCVTLARAVRTAKRYAKSGDIVLLSPACASFDQFKDFEDRGRVFKRLVRNMR
jgi:UDP-N-acetylmuramoylalanine--D-glutamate ligase